MLTVFLYRHAKSAPGGIFTDDHDRALNERGRRAAGAMGRYLAHGAGDIDLALCSTAQRARETWELSAAELATPPPVSFEDELYLVSGPAIAARLAALAGQVATVVLVGHNPGIRQACLMLAASGAPEHLDLARGKFPTAALAHLRFDCARWADLAAGAGRLCDFQTPKLVAARADAD